MKRPQGVKPGLAAKMAGAFLLAVLPVIIGNIIMYMQGTALLYARSQSSMNSRQEYVAKNIENIVSTIYTGEMSLIAGVDIGYLIDLYDVSSNYQKFRMIEEVQDSIDMFVAGNSWIADMRVYIPSIGRMLQSGESVSVMDAKYEWLEETSKGNYISFAESDGNFVIITREGTAEKILYLAAVEISSEKITELFWYLFSQQESDLILASQEGFVFSQAGNNTSKAFGHRCMQAAKEIEEGRVQSVRMGGTDYLMRRDSVFFENFTLLSVVSYDLIFSDIFLYRLLFGIFLPVSLAASALFAVFFFRQFNRPVLELNRAFAAVCTGNFSIRVKAGKNSDFIQLYTGFNYMVEKIQDLIRSGYQQKILMQQAELRQLHAQVDPHFLHNGFLNICAMAQMEDYEGIEEMAVKLSQYYQYISRAEQNAVSLEEEFRFVSLYAGIQNVRFGERIVCDIQPLPEGLRSVPFPRFCLQTLVENSYKYGAGTREGGMIRVSFQEDTESFCILVRDNGQNFTNEKLEELNRLFECGELPDSGTGLYNVYHRIRLFYHNGSMLKLSCTSQGGLQAAVYIRKPEKKEGTAHV